MCVFVGGVVVVVVGGWCVVDFVWFGWLFGVLGRWCVGGGFYCYVGVVVVL